MSQKELEQTDQEVMEMVNDHAHPDATEAAQVIQHVVGSYAAGRKVKEPTPEELEKAAAERAWLEQVAEEKRKVKKVKIQEAVRALVLVAVCVLVAVLLVAAHFAPDVVIWIVNGGVLCCGIVAALIVDRWIRRWTGNW